MLMGRLQWSNFKKTMILIVVSFYSFLGNAALVGPGVYITIWAKEFQISQTEASGLISYSNLAFGFGRSSQFQLQQAQSTADADFIGSLILVPLYLKIGRRPVMLMSLLIVRAPHTFNKES